MDRRACTWVTTERERGTVVAEGYRPIPGFDGYEINRRGVVRSWLLPGPAGKRAKRPTEKNPHFDRELRAYVTLRKGNKWHRVYVADLVRDVWGEQERNSA